MSDELNNALLAQMDPCTQFSGKFVTGYGKTDTHTIGKTVHRYTGQNYLTVNLQEIINRTQNPQAVDKDQGQWIIPSEYCAHDARLSKPQIEHGIYWALACDIDKGNPTVADVARVTKEIFGNVFFLLWSTPSCEPQDQRWRVLIPTKHPMGYRAFKAFQIVWFREMYNRQIQCDHALLKPNQILYLPNRGQFYHHEKHEGTLFDQHAWPYKRDAEAYHQNWLEAERKKQERRPKFEDEYSPFAYVRKTFDLHTVLLTKEAGYIQNPNNPNQFRSPTSQSSGYAVETYNDGGWHSLHGSDREAGFTSGDVSDIFRRFFGWSHEDVIGTGLGLRAGFNPAGIPYKQIPALARVPQFSGRIKLPDGTYLHAGRKKEPPALTEALKRQSQHYQDGAR